jgi:hypothetical protein
MLLTKQTNAKSDGWQLMAMTQFDHMGLPAFLHRTINKFWLGSEAWPVELVTGPMPYRWGRALCVGGGRVCVGGGGGWGLMPP